MYNILTLAEIIEQVQSGLIPVPENPQDAWMKVYWTSLHKERNLVGFIPYKEVLGYIERNKKYMNAVFWGTKK